jgi:hypothetical protein
LLSPLVGLVHSLAAAVRALRWALLRGVSILLNPYIGRWQASKLLRGLGVRAAEWKRMDGGSGFLSWRISTSDGRLIFAKAIGSAWIFERLVSRRHRALLAHLPAAERLRRGAMSAARFYELGIGPEVLAIGRTAAAHSWIHGYSLSGAPMVSAATLGLVVEAVEALHVAGETHGDLHIGNVHISTDGTPLLLDPDNRFKPGVTFKERCLYDWGLLLGSLCEWSPGAQALVRQRLNAPAHGVEGTLGDALAGFLARYRTDNRFLGALADWMTTIEAQA